MKTFTVRAHNLKTAIKNAAQICERRNRMPILTCVSINIHNGQLTINSTDLECSLSEKIRCETDGGLAYGFTLPVKELSAALDELFGSTKGVDFEIVGHYDETNKELNLLGNGQKWGLVVQDFNDFPIFPAFPENSSLNVEFKNLIDKVIHAVSHDETRYHLNGAFLDVTEKSVVMVATDGHRLSYFEEARINTQKVNFIIPVKGMKQIAKLFKNEEVLVKDGGSFLFVSCLTKTLIIRKVEGRYPNYRQFMPQRFSNYLEVKRKDLIKICKALKPDTDKKSGAVYFKIEKDVVSFENKTEIIIFEGSGKDRKEILTRLPKQAHKVDGKIKSVDLRIAFNVNYLMDALEAMAEDKVKIEINDRLSPFRITDKTGAIHIIMPMRV